MNQTESIKKYLSPPGRKIDPMKALKLFGCFRLSARIWDLKKQGCDIRMELKTKGKKTYSQYYFA